MVLRIDSVSHHKLNETSTPEVYTINDQIVRLVLLGVCISTYYRGFQVYTAKISKYDSKTSSWEPYSGLKDLQLEFTMLDPHIRTFLPPVRGSPGTYSVTFRAPDRHGVFKFVIDYKRKG